jgi:hypothetical protein
MPLALIGRWGIAAYPLIFVILEEVRNRFPFGGFGWARVAYSQADAPYAAIAARGGVISLSAITVLLAAFVYFAAQKNVKLLFVLPLLTLLIPNNIVESNQTSVLMIQGNVPELGLDFNARAKAVFNNHVAQTKVALTENREVDFIVWPENSVDVDPYTNEDVYEGDACIFLDSDLYNKKLFTDENKSITRDMIERKEKDLGKNVKLRPGKHYTVKCDECKKYIYKDDKGQCTPYAYDGRYTASNSLGVCTAIGYAKPCDQEAKILQ